MHDILLPKGMCSESRDLLKIWGKICLKPFQLPYLVKHSTNLLTEVSFLNLLVAELLVKWWPSAIADF